MKMGGCFGEDRRMLWCRLEDALGKIGGCYGGRLEDILVKMER